MSERVAIPASDQTWLHMDRPNNLMYVHSLMWFPESPGLEGLKALLTERMIDRFPVFSRRAVEDDGQWYWEDDPTFSLDDHVSEVALDGSVADLRDHVGSRFSEPFDRSRPLWEVELITGVDDLGTVMFTRFHHALADGVRLTQLLLSLCDLAEETDADQVLPTTVGRRGVPGPLSVGVGALRHGVGDALDFAGNVGKGAFRLPGKAVHALGPRVFQEGLGLVMNPARLIDVAATLGSPDNAAVNTMTELTRMLSAPRSVATVWSGTPGVDKGVSWATGLDLARVKELGREHGGTVNDILLAVVSRALTRYLAEQNSPVDEIAWLVPVSLVPLDANLPKDLGNHFSLIFVEMPLGHSSTARLVRDLSERMTRLKSSAEPIVAFGLQWAIAESPRALAVRVTNLFANKAVGVLTNVPGPRRPMTFAGVPVSGVLGWAPTSGDQPLSISIFSYAGQVSIGIAADAGLIPDPDRIAHLLEDEFATM